MKKLLVSGLAILIAPVAFAGGTWSNVTVTFIAPCTSAEGCGTAGFVQVGFSANSTGGPSCATNKNYATVDVSTPIGAYIAAVLQSARLTGSTITAYGIGNCNLYAYTETLGEVVE